MRLFILPFFIFAAVCFFLFMGYTARYAFVKKQITPLFLLYKKLGYVDLNSL